MCVTDAQTVDLVDMLVKRGIKPAAAAAFLDTCPPLAVSVWVKKGFNHRGAQLEGYAAVVLDKGRERGAFLPEGVSTPLDFLTPTSKAFKFLVHTT